MLKISMILFGLVLITSHFTSGLYAKYTSKSTSSDFARVASFKIETELDLDNVSMGITEGGNPSFELGGEDEIASIRIPFYIESASEVAVAYSVEVNFGNGVTLPHDLILTLSNSVNSKSILSNGNTLFVFDEFGTLLPKNISSENQRDELQLIVSILDLTNITEEITIPNIELTVKVYQID